MKFDYTKPRLIGPTTKLLPILDRSRAILKNPKVIIQGSYFTTNIGDRVIGIILKQELEQRGVRSILVSRFCTKTKTRNVVVGGGGIMHNHYPENLSLRTAFLGHNNVIYTGIGCPGFDPMSADDKENLSKLKKAKYISVRDQFSKDTLTNVCDVFTEVLACPSWLIKRHIEEKDLSFINLAFRSYYNLKYATNYPINNNKSTQKIGLVMNGFFDLRHLPSIKKKIKELSQTSDIYFIPFVGKDMEFYQKELSDLEIQAIKLQGPFTTFKVVQKMDWMIATRYHSVIYSLLANKPVLILAYSQKVASLARDLQLKFVNLMEMGDKKFDFNFNYEISFINKKVAEADLQIKRIIDNLV